MTVTPVADPCVGNLATPVNSSYFSRAFLNALPAYRPSLSPNRRGLEVGMAHGFFLYGPFAITGPVSCCHLVRRPTWAGVAGSRMARATGPSETAMTRSAASGSSGR